MMTCLESEPLGNENKNGQPLNPQSRKAFVGEPRSSELGCCWQPSARILLYRKSLQSCCWEWLLQLSWDWWLTLLHSEPYACEWGKHAMGGGDGRETKSRGLYCLSFHWIPPEQLSSAKGQPRPEVPLSNADDNPHGGFVFLHAFFFYYMVLLFDNQMYL